MVSTYDYHRKTQRAVKIVCTMCGQEAFVGGAHAKYCESCRPKAIQALNVKHEKARRERLRAEKPKVCKDCGKPLDDQRAHRCEECRQTKGALIMAEHYLKVELYRLSELNPDKAKAMLQEIVEEEGPEFAQRIAKAIPLFQEGN